MNPPEDDELIELAASAAHDVNRIYCQSIGEYAHPEWTDAPDWQKRSVRVGVRLILDHPDTRPEQSHKSWLAEKWAEGWVYGPVKDPKKKTHPCCVSWDGLPLAQRAKDFLFSDTVRGVIAAYRSKPQ